MHNFLFFPLLLYNTSASPDESTSRSSEIYLVLNAPTNTILTQATIIFHVDSNHVLVSLLSSYFFYFLPSGLFL